MRHATPSNKNSDAAREACMEDVVAVLFADENAFASFAAWIDADLERLEARFAQYTTNDSLTPSPRRKRK